MLLLTLLLFLAPLAVNAQSASNSFTMRVYSDGSAAIVQALTVNASAVSITVPLLSSIVTNVFATDQNGNPLSFQISGNNITVYTVGATGVTIEYDTDALTSKQGTVWTLEFTTSYNLTVILPPKSTLSSVSGTPTSLSEQNGSPVVVVSLGKWTIRYGVPVEATASSTSSMSSGQSSSSETTTLTTSQHSSGHSTNGASFQYIVIAIAVTAVVTVAIYLILRRRGNEIQSTELRADDLQVLNYISEKGGKVFEQEIRARFTLPKTSAWRQIKRLERLGYVKVYKIGSQNQIELLKKVE